MYVAVVFSCKDNALKVRINQIKNNNGVTVGFAQKPLNP